MKKFLFISDYQFFSKASQILKTVLKHDCKQLVARVLITCEPTLQGYMLYTAPEFLPPGIRSSLTAEQRYFSFKKNNYQ